MGYFEKSIQKYLSVIQKRAEDVAKNVSSEVGKAADEYAAKIIVPVAKDAIREDYISAVDSWYGGYSPKRYKRAYSLYNHLEITNPGNNGIGWSVNEDMYKRSWNGGMFNIYDIVYVHGYHGGPIGKLGGFSAARSTPIPDKFDEYTENTHSTLQEQFTEIGQKYFSENFPIVFRERFSL